MKAAPAIAALALAGSVFGQAYPSKPIRIVTQYVPGSSGDNSLRFVAPAMSTSLGQPVVIENRAGAGGVVAAQTVMSAAPDGYSILASNSATHVIRTFLVKDMPFDPAKDFAPITQYTEGAAAIVVSPSFPAKTMKELLDYARANPGKVSFGTSGIGSEHHLSAEGIMQITGLKLVHVPYKSGAQAMLDVSAGQLPMAVGVLGGALPLISSGKLRLLAVVGSKRLPRMPEVPAVSESVPGFEAPSSFTGIFGPAALPLPIARRLSDEFRKAAKDPETTDKLVKSGTEPVCSTPEEFRAAITHELALVRRIVQAAGIKPE